MSPVKGAAGQCLPWAGCWNGYSLRLLSNLCCYNLNSGKKLRTRVVLNRALTFSKEKTRNIGIVDGIRSW